jgi:hypothetical protein
MLVEHGALFELAPPVGMANSNTPTPKLSPTLVAATRLVGLLATSIGPVHLIEEKVFAQFSDEVKTKGWHWVLDNDMSNHMTDVRKVLDQFCSSARSVSTKLYLVYI